MRAEGTTARKSESARLGFGANWMRYLDLADDERIAVIERTLWDMLEGMTTVDVRHGCNVYVLRAPLADR